MNKINIGIIGFGTVGSGVVKVIQTRKNFLREKTGIDINIAKICDKDLSTPRIIKVDKKILTKNADEIINDPKIDIVVELIGGIHPAKEIIAQSLRKGKYVVTANKALLAEEGNELFSLAKSCGKDIYFEAAVAAGVPIIKSVRESLIANRFDAIYGILNGTSNFILSLMGEQHCKFQEALEIARQKGYAERNSSLDIEGIDSAHKLILLSYLAFGKLINIKDIHIEGISRVSPLDIKYSQELGYKIKLLAIAKKDLDELEIRVHPTLVSEDTLLASVDGVFNAIKISSDLAGDLLFYGQGAGRFPTSSAIISDIVELTKNIKAGLFKSTINITQDASIKKLRKIEEFESHYYIRFMAIDKPGMLAKISGVLGHYGISIASVSQKERKHAKIVPIVMITHDAQEGPLKKALSEIDHLSVVKENSIAIRMEDLK